ncbi:CoA-binding protein [Corynebacterium phocae]|uniref:CoA-binding protein n=1 Tax=Corynebacterium phocae TaxID=161895 RepID=A0A1L7D3G6_9CORY|nr:GNAT family N-acetyltransferase [Corynebacterium phocae]APT92650.1 CoA-binding protein [Corynebacterium phocae]KAA8723703.1 GNAT family N-acetyltransferase [Corynebacterium phocae]
MTAPLEKWEADVILNDGGIASLRHIAPGDEDAIRRFYDRVSDRSKYLRFFSTHPELTDTDMQRWFGTEGYGAYDKVTLVMEERGEIVAVAGYELVKALLPARVGDVSFLVQDSHQGRGVGPIFLEHLAEIGREGKVERFFAEMLTQNRGMIQVFKRAGYSVTPELEDGFITVDFTIAPNENSREVMERRELRAEANSIKRLLSPSSVALVGDMSALRTLTPSLLQGGYSGQLHILTSPEASGLEALRALNSDVDLVLVDHLPEDIAQLMEAAAAKNATGVVVVAQNSNTGINSTQAREIVSTARDYGLRALGPAALGLINTGAGVNLNASPAPQPRAGHVGLFAQSGGVATLALSQAIAQGCGISSFIGAGSFADVTGNDVMQFWSEDPATKVCLLTPDTIGNPRKFFRVLRRLSLEKHVVVFLPSRALRTARHYEQHGLSQASPQALDEVIRQTGAMVVTRRDTMYNIAQILSRQPLPNGNRVAVISNSAGLVEQMQHASLRFDLVPHPRTVLGEPVAAIAAAVQEALDDPTVDAVLAAVVEVGQPVLNTAYAELSGMAAHTAKPLIASFVGFGQPQEDFSGPESQGQLPTCATYADGLEALAAIIDNERKRSTARPSPEDETATGDKTRSRQVVEQILADQPAGRWATDDEAAEILSAYGLNLVAWQAVDSLEEATATAKDMGWNVVLKSVNPVLRGRPELPTIVRNIQDAESMAQAWETLGQLTAALQDGDVGALMPVVQPMVASGTSLTVSAIEDPVVGPILSAGISGIPSEILGDKTWRVPPLRRVDARGMLDELTAAPLLNGVGGTKPSRLDTVEDVLMRVAALKDDNPQIVEVELSPVIAGSADTHIVGARLRIAPLSTQRDPLARSL